MLPERRIAAHHFEALGTSCSLFAVDESGIDLRQSEHWVRALGARLTRFDDSSELSRLNTGPGRWTSISPELEDVLRTSLRAFELSAGLVNIAVLPAMLAIGYTRPLVHGPTASAPVAIDVPDLPDVLEVRYREARLRPGCALDLGGIAKGWMADRLSESLGENVLVNLGGDLRARGVGPAGQGWPVGLGGTTVLLGDHGAATSSVRRRRWAGDMHHVIDPRTGRPSESGLVEVSVVAATALDAEVVAKTALIAGPELAPFLCAAHAEAWWLL